MAEVLGAVASAVQLADVALRSSRQIYEVLSSIRHASEDFQTLRNILQDVDSNMRILRIYIIEFGRSRHAIEEYEVLPDTITGCFRKFHDDINVLKKILPDESKVGVAAKAKWVFDKDKLKSVMMRLNDLKTSVIMALLVIGAKDNLYLRQGNTEIIQHQTQTSTAFTNQFQDLNASFQAQARNDAHLLELQKNSFDKISQQHDAAFVSISEQYRSIDANIGISLESSAAIQTSLQRVVSTACFSASKFDTAAAVLRTQLLSDFETVLDRVSIKSSTQLEAIRDRLEKISGQISSDYARHAHTTHPEDRERNFQSMYGSNHVDQSSIIDYNRVWPVNRSRDTSGVRSPHPFHHPSYPVLCTSSTYRKFWAGKGRLGNLQIEIEAVSRRAEDPSTAHTTFTITIHLRPHQDLIPLRGFAMHWTTAPNQQGFYHLGPSIATFPIISDLKAVPCILYGDLHALQQMLAAGEIHLRCQDMLGRTLLHFAAAFGRPDICEFLNSHGLHWNQQNHYGQTPMHLALIGLILNHKAKRVADYVILLQRFETSGVFIDDLSRQLPVINRGFPLVLEDTEAQSEILDYILHHSETAWHNYFNWVIGWTLPTRGASETIKLSLDRGLNPNISTQNSYSLLLEAFATMAPFVKSDLQNYRNDQTPKDADRHLKDMVDLDLYVLRPEAPQEASQALKFAEYWCIITTLVRGGADIFVIEPDSLDVAMTFQWESALREYGLVPEDVYQEDIQRRKQAIRLRGATRTGIDEGALDLPSRSGLRCRKRRGTSVKKSCSHPLGVFDI
ncbi:Nn.00g108170.m01.CDS01 [Neocucurbitaria sp. VM-36]